MAGSSLLALIDDIATLLDDISVMTKVAAKKTAGVLGDDLALNAQQVSGVRAERELPIVWSVAKGSARNKLILVPAALALSALLPQLIIPLLLCGGLFLCYEGFEKIWHLTMHRNAVVEHKAKLKQKLKDGAANLAAFEQDKIKGAIRTDFVLSAEIIVITLGAVSEASFLEQSLVVVLIAILMTIGVYGLVALIVKLDDIGLHLLNSDEDSFASGFRQHMGRGLLAFCPWLMKTLSVVGTAAMFLVGGGIFSHNIEILHHLIENTVALAPEVALLAGLVSVIVHLLLGVLLGALALATVSIVQALRKPADRTY